MNAAQTRSCAKLLSPWEKLGKGGSWRAAKIAIEANLRGLGYGG